jgi:hypothetical protein
LSPDLFKLQEDSDKLSTLEYLDFWLRSIYAHASTTNKTTELNTYSPPVLIVGTHKDCLHSETDVINQTVSYFISL